MTRIQLIHYCKQNGNELFPTNLTYGNNGVYHTNVIYNSDFLKKDNQYFLAGKVVKNELDSNGIYKHKSTLFGLSNSLRIKKKEYIDSSLLSSYVNIINKTNSSVIVTGHYYLPKPVYQFRTFIREIDTAGNILWEKRYGMPFQCHLIPKSIVKTKDNGFLLVCEEKETYNRIPSSNSSDITNWRITIIKIDSIGNELWRKPIGMPEKYNIKSSNILSVDDSTYYIAWSNNDSLYHDILWGKYRSGPHSNASIYLTKFDYHTGEFIWRRNEIRPMIDSHIIFTSEIRSIIETQDGGLLFGGEYIVDNPRLGQHTFIIKADKYGCMKPGCHTQDKWYLDSINKPPLLDDEIKIYPNPTQGHFTIEIPDVFSEQDIVTINIYTINGKLVKQLSLDKTRSILDTKGLESGIYLIRITNLSIVSKKTYKLMIN